jgi:hypothetical protein
MSNVAVASFRYKAVGTPEFQTFSKSVVTESQETRLALPISCKNMTSVVIVLTTFVCKI